MVLKPEMMSDDEEDEVLWKMNLLVCHTLPNTQSYSVSYPVSKKDAWDAARFPIARYKKNVRLLEMRFLTDTQTGSYDKKKADLMYADGEKSSPQKGHGAGIEAARSNDEIYEGRAFVRDQPMINSVAFIKNEKMCVHPITGSFEMHRSLSALNKKKKKSGGKAGENENDTETEDEEAEDQKTPTSSAVRVKFSRPETERQKKRREASALHREKKIASDVWLGVKVHLKNDPPVTEKMDKMSETIHTKSEFAHLEPAELGIRELVNKAIICGFKDELVIEAGKEHMLSKQRIDELAPELQIKAHMVKSHVMRTSEMRELIDPRKMGLDAMIAHLKQCARLVQGVWVLDSSLMFNNLPPAHSNTAGKTDIYRAELWRNARDLALALLDAGQRVTRLTLMTCFKLSDKDADEILSTFGVKVDRSWRLRIERDDELLNDKSMELLIATEKERWIEVLGDLKRALNPPKSPKKK